MGTTRRLSMREVLEFAKRNRKDYVVNDEPEVHTHHPRGWDQHIMNIGVSSDDTEVEEEEIVEVIDEPEEIIPTKRNNYTVIKVRQIPKAMSYGNSLDRVPITDNDVVINISTDLDLFDLDPIVVDGSGDEPNAKYVDNDLEELSTYNMITNQVKNKLILLYLNGDADLMAEMKNLLFSIQKHVIVSECIEKNEWENMICSDVSVSIMNYGEFIKFISVHKLDSKINILDNDQYLVEYVLYTSKDGSGKTSEFYRILSCGDSKETSDKIHYFKI